MADLTITPASVLAGAGSAIEHGVAGTTITAGQVLYLDTASTGKWLLADADAATAIARGSAKIGVALHGASSGQPIAVHKEGDLALGAVLTAGISYFLSGTSGGICPVADVTGGEYFVFLGQAKSTSVLAFRPQYSGVASA